MGNVKIKTGDMFKSEAQTLVNTVNTVGVMGKGIALSFRLRFPEMYKDYVRRCRSGQVKLGRPYLYTDLTHQWVLNFPTKKHWRSVSRLADIEEGLRYLKQNYKHWGIKSLAVPPLGCGNGQLDWKVVGPTLYRHLSELEIPVELYAPTGTPSAELDVAFLAGATGGVTAESRLEPHEVALVAVLSCLWREPYRWPVGRTSFQKMAYFLEEAGVPMNLKFQRGSFGPFSPALKSVITKLANNGLLEEVHKGRMLEVRPGRTYWDARYLHKDFLKRWRPEIERVADLFMRLPQTRDAEVAATVHFAAKELAYNLGRKPSENEVLAAVMEWKAQRKPPFNQDEVAEWVRNLNVMGWIELTVSELFPVKFDEAMYA